LAAFLFLSREMSRHFLISPNPFKGTYSALQVANALRRGLIQAGVHVKDICLIPMADGGPGTLDVLQTALGGKFRRARVQGPLGKIRSARWLKVGRLAVIESAEAVGLTLVPKHDRNALAASSYGLGQLILAARVAGCGEILLGLGGTATTDGGAGMAQALGWRLRDAQGEDLKPGGESLGRLESVRAPSLKRFSRLKIKVLCDVKNPLYGIRGAAHVFSPQKGASPIQVKILDQGLRRLARFMRPGLSSYSGGGAAGGLGAGLMHFCGARLVPGATTLMRLSGFSSSLRRSDIVFTGEGYFDSQSLQGKLPYAVAQKARALGKRCVIFCGFAEPGLRPKGIDIVSLRKRSIEEAVKDWVKQSGFY
jgi:glycerate kinase